MEKPSDEEILTAGIAQFSVSIGAYCWRNAIPYPLWFCSTRQLTLLVLYYDQKPSSIPTVTTSKKWGDDYMINASASKFKSEDLWAARCGLLHQHIPSSEPVTKRATLNSFTIFALTAKQSHQKCSMP